MCHCSIFQLSLSLSFSSPPWNIWTARGSTTANWSSSSLSHLRHYSVGHSLSFPTAVEHRLLLAPTTPSWHSSQSHGCSFNWNERCLLWNCNWDGCWCGKRSFSKIPVSRTSRRMFMFQTLEFWLICCVQSSMSHRTLSRYTTSHNNLSKKNWVQMNNVLLQRILNSQS